MGTAHSFERVMLYFYSVVISLERKTKRKGYMPKRQCTVVPYANIHPKISSALPIW